MTRKLLLEKICFGDCVYGCVVYSSCDCDYCEVKLNELLDEYDKQIRADAIDDFAKRLKAECRIHYVDCDPYFGGIQDSILYEDDIDEIAEELKAGVNNE